MHAPTGLRGGRALVTGAAKRLGREIALRLAREGTILALHYNRSVAPAKELAREIREAGGQCVLIQADLGSPESVEELFERTWEQLGELDFLVNNASIFPPGRLDDLNLEALDEILRVNSWAPFALTRSLWRRLRGSGREGSVVNLLDTRLVGGDLAHAAYHLSKALLKELTTLTALEFAPEVRVNGVAPGAVLPPEGQDEGYLAALAGGLPLQRYGSPADIVDATVYLLKASFVTGQVIFVDGGRHLRLGGST